MEVFFINVRHFESFRGFKSIYISDLQQFEIYQQSNVQIKHLTQYIQTFSPPFGPLTRAKVSHLEKNNVQACHALINASLAKL
jgi:hypothetical protein